VIDLFAAWAAKEQDTYKNEGNQGNQGNPVEITSAFPVTHPENERVTRVTELPKLPNGNQKGKPNFSNYINKFTQVTQVTPKNTATPREYEARPLSASEVEEVHAWPPETQRVFVAVLGHFENQGYELPQAEPLAWATVKALMERHGGPVGFKSEAVNHSGAGSRALPAEVVPLVEMVKSVFGPDTKIRWEA